MDWMDLATQILAGLILGAISWMIHSMRGLGRRLDEFESAVDGRIDPLEQRLVRVEELKRHNVIERVGDLERQVAACTSQDQLRRIHARIDDDVKARAELGQEISAVAGKVDAIHGTMQVIQKHLMERGGTP